MESDKIAKNNDNPSRSKTAIEANCELITEKRAANAFADLTRNKAPHMLPESATSGSERKQRSSFCHRTAKNETVPLQIPSA